MIEFAWFLAGAGWMVAIVTIVAIVVFTIDGHAELQRRKETEGEH